MAPKSAQKTKAKKENTPPPSPNPKPKAPAAPASAKKKAPPKEVAFYRALAKDKSQTIPIDVSFEGNTAVSKLDNSSGIFSHGLKLTASGSFSLVKTFVLQGGDYDGMQAILIRPAKAFNFNGLPEEVRARVYRHYFAPKGIMSGTITLEGKRKSNSEVYAKDYSEGSKDRVALLAVNKEIYEKALPVLYSHTLAIENTTTLMEFLSNIREVRPHITSIHMKTWVKTTSKTAMGILAESPRITSFHIEQGVFNEGDPGKAAKLFYDQAYKFLEAVGAVKRDPIAGVDVLSFGRQAFKYKDEQKVEKPWTSEAVEEFKKALKEKLSPKS